MDLSRQLPNELGNFPLTYDQIGEVLLDYFPCALPLLEAFTENCFKGVSVRVNYDISLAIFPEYDATGPFLTLYTTDEEEDYLAVISLCLSLESPSVFVHKRIEQASAERYIQGSAFKEKILNSDFRTLAGLYRGWIVTPGV
jgi:hypothetical protein